jgi:nitroreductase
MNDILKAIQARRSVRRFNPEPLAREQIELVLEAARWAPSGKNTQPWRFVVVKDEEKKKALAKLAPQREMIATASITLAVFLDKEAGYDALKDAQGIGACIQNILLAVHSLGLGACWMGKARDSEIERLLEAKESEELMALIPIGHPAESPAPTPRHPLPEILRFV